MKIQQDSSFPKTILSGQEGPIFSDFSDKEKREKTFGYCSRSPDPQMTPEVLASYGLFTTGDGKVRCFYCGAGFRDWDKGYNPMPMHQQLSPMCPYATMIKTQRYLEKNQNQQATATVDDRFSAAAAQSCLQTATDGPMAGEGQGSQRGADHLDSVAAQSCIQMGFSEASVQRAIQKFTAARGNLDFKGEDLCEILLDEEEDDVPRNMVDCISPVEEAVKTQAESVKHEEKNKEHEDDVSIDEERLRLRDLIGCSICSGEFDAMMNLSWQHMSTCPDCFSQALALPRYSALAMFYLREFTHLYYS